MQERFGAGNDSWRAMQCRGNMANQVRLGDVLLISDQKAIIGCGRMIQKERKKITQVENTRQTSTAVQTTSPPAKQCDAIRTSEGHSMLASVAIWHSLSSASHFDFP
jgi:hypothetical protein